MRCSGERVRCFCCFCFAPLVLTGRALSYTSYSSRPRRSTTSLPLPHIPSCLPFSRVVVYGLGTPTATPPPFHLPPRTSCFSSSGSCLCCLPSPLRSGHFSSSSAHMEPDARANRMRPLRRWCTCGLPHNGPQRSLRESRSPEPRGGKPTCFTRRVRDVLLPPLPASSSVSALTFLGTGITVPPSLPVKSDWPALVRRT